MEYSSGREERVSAPVEVVEANNSDGSGPGLEESVSVPVEVVPVEIEDDDDPGRLGSEIELQLDLTSPDLTSPDLTSPDLTSLDREASPDVEVADSSEPEPDNDPDIPSAEAALPAGCGTGREETEEVLVEQTIAPEDGAVLTDEPGRYPARQRRKPERLHYPGLGNPFISVIQSLFQGLSNAFTSSLVDPDSTVPSLPPLDVPVTAQPLKHAAGRAWIQGGRM